jgi:hypothetical protein
MVDQDIFKTIALSFPDTEELPHFEKLSYRWRSKIFATLDVKLNRGMVQLSLIDQDVFCAFDSAVFYPVPGGWGKRGSTFVNLDKVVAGMLKDAIDCAYQTLIDKQKPKAK